MLVARFTLFISGQCLLHVRCLTELFVNYNLKGNQTENKYFFSNFSSILINIYMASIISRGILRYDLKQHRIIMCILHSWGSCT